MLVIILIVLQVMDTFLLFRLMKKGSFVTVQNHPDYLLHIHSIERLID